MPLDKIISRAVDTGIQRYFRNNIEMEKGAILTTARIEKNRKLYEKYCTYFSTYPDLFIDLITPQTSNFQLFFYQRIFLRACMRYRYHYCTACRAFSKTFVSILALILKCVFQPRSKLFICAPGKEQSAKVAKEKIIEIFNLFPLLKKEIIGEGNFGKDYVTLSFRNHSQFDVVGALDTTRGGRRHGFGFIFDLLKFYSFSEESLLIYRRQYGGIEYGRLYL